MAIDVFRKVQNDITILDVSDLAPVVNNFEDIYEFLCQVEVIQIVPILLCKVLRKGVEVIQF